MFLPVSGWFPHPSYAAGFSGWLGRHLLSVDKRGLMRQSLLPIASHPLSRTEQKSWEEEWTNIYLLKNKSTFARDHMILRNIHLKHFWRFLHKIWFCKTLRVFDTFIERSTQLKLKLILGNVFQSETNLIQPLKWRNKYLKTHFDIEIKARNTNILLY